MNTLPLPLLVLPLVGACVSDADRDARFAWVADLAVGDGFLCTVDAGGTAACVGEPALEPGPGRYAQISGRYRHVCARTEAGRVTCTGPDPLDPALAAPNEPWAYIDAGWADTCGIRADGTVGCWGNTPEIVSDVPVGTFTRVAVGRWHACALSETSAASCWGQQDNQRTLGNPGPFVNLAVGLDGGCGLSEAPGSPLCWGTTGVLPDPPLLALDLGPVDACGIRPDGSVPCTGALADGAPAEGVRVRVGDGFACAVSPEGNASCFGDVPIDLPGAD